MSVFAGKNILVIGDETNQVHSIERELELRGANILRTTCGTDSHTNPELLQSDIIFLNHLHDGNFCIDLLNTLGSSKMSRVIPIFALVTNDELSIEKALNLGAADYFTPDESVEDIIKKIKQALGEPDVSGRSIIEVNEEQLNLRREGVKVYAIEDDPLLANLLTMRLEQAKFTVFIDSTGDEAISKIVSFKPDVVLLDLTLPKRSGFEILELIRQEESIADIPVIVFSNRDSDEDKERASKLGARAFFIKVMTDFSELIQAIERLA